MEGTELVDGVSIVAGRSSFKGRITTIGRLESPVEKIDSCSDLGNRFVFEIHLKYQVTYWQTLVME